MNYKDFFKDKKISVVGLGPHGEMTADIKFLLRLGTHISLYDTRSEARLLGFLPDLIQSGLTDYNLGKISAEDFSGSDLIILSPEISRRAGFLKKATSDGIRIEFANVLFMKLTPPITLIGIMGSCGKSTVSRMLYGILKQSFVEYEDQGLYFIDPDLPNGALTHLKKIKPGDVVLARITEEMIKEYHAERISPHVAVITSPISFDLIKYQTYNNFIVAPDVVVDAIRDTAGFAPKGKMLRTKNDNASLAIQTSQLFKVPQEVAKRITDEFSGLKGRQEFVKKVSGIEFYNDAASVTPSATLFALQKFSIEKNIILIFGGAYTGHDYSELIEKIPEYAHAVILLPGSASLGFRTEVEALKNIRFLQSPTMEDAVVMAKEYGKKGDRVVFSPGCEAIGIHISRRERGEKFVKAIRSL